MHGQNPILVQDLSRADRLQVGDVWRTVQGEGPFAGVPAIFVRLAGCWLKCYWCDTEFMKGINTAFSPEDVLKRVRQADDRQYPIKLVVLTGGDPLRQNIVPLCTVLTHAGFHVQLETAGVKWVPGLEVFCIGGSHLLPPGVSIVLSPKTGHVDRTVAIHATSWKYIIDIDDEINPEDGLPDSSTQVPGKHQRLARPPEVLPRNRIFLQPCDRGDPDRNKSNTDLVAQLAMNYGYRVSLQTHKILGLP